MGYETNGTLRGNENFGYGYDGAENLAFRTNNTLIQAFTSDNANELLNATRNNNLLTVAGDLTHSLSGLSVNGQAGSIYADQTFAVTNGVALNNGLNTFTTVVVQGAISLTNTLTQNLPVSASLHYDLNGNLISDGQYGYLYVCANELTQVTAINQWQVQYVYDGFGRRRVRKAYEWVGGTWLESGEVRYIYDGMTVLQERNLQNSPIVTYTRGSDLSGSLQGAGGVGGLLARTDLNGNSYYHSDGNGNVTMLVDSEGNQLAKYLYDPYGNTLGMWGSLALGNTYRFSSKEIDANFGSYYYGYRYYQPNLQRWPNRDLIGELGGINLFEFVANNPVEDGDYYGLASVAGPGGTLGGLSGPFKGPGGFVSGLKNGGLATIGGAILSHYGNQMMAGCGSNCKKPDCESCCKKGAALSGLGDAAGAAAGCIGTFGWGCVFAGIGAAINGYDTYNDYKSCMAGCASKSN